MRALPLKSDSLHLSSERNDPRQHRHQVYHGGILEDYHYHDPRMTRRGLNVDQIYCLLTLEQGGQVIIREEVGQWVVV